MGVRGDDRQSQAAIAAWLRRASAILPLTLCALLAIALIGVILDPVHDKRQFTAFLFIRQDLVFAVGIALLLRFALAPRDRAPTPWMEAVDRHPWLVALLLGLICWAGHHWLLRGYDLTRDEQMASLDAAIFAHGRLNWPIAATWRPLAEALNQFFVLPIADRQAWVSAYLPVNAASRAFFSLLGDAGLASPAFTMIGALALWRITLRLWPDDRAARTVALLLYAGSSQVLLLGMTAHAMAGHLALNLLWLALFLRGGAWSHAGAILVAFLATGLHQPLFHPLFVLPFMVGLLLQRRWPLAIVYGAAYLVIGLFWLAWPHLMTTWAGGPLEALSGTGDRIGYLDRIALLLHDLGPVSLWLMAMNLLRFIAWQHLLLLPLAAAGIGLAWRAPLVRPLAIGIALHVVVIGLLLAFQGHGWGYRYLHGIIGSACLLGAQGWHSLRGHWPGTRLWIWGNVATFAVSLPLHAWMAARLTLPYADASAAIDHIPADIVVVDEGAVAFGSDLVINRPDLSNRPIRLLAGSLTVPQTIALCRAQTVAFVGGADLGPIRRTIDAAPGNDSHVRALRAACRKEGR